MELKEYLIPLRRWWWLLLLTTIISTLSSYGATQLQVPLYQTTAALMIGQAIEDPNPNNTSLYLTQQLALSYAEIAQRQLVRQGTMELLGLTWLPDYEVRIVPNTQLLEITVTDSDPLRAQAVANTLADQLVRQSPVADEDEQQQRQSFVNEQLDSLEQKIADTQTEILDLQDEMTSMISARQIADAQSQIAALEATLNTLQTNYATLLANTREGAINTLRIIEPAIFPTTPVNDNLAATLALGAAIGFTLAAGAAYLMEHLDNTLKSPEEFSKVTGLPIIGFFGETKSKILEESVIVAKEPRSAIAEAFRSLRTNLEFASVDHPLRTILITGPDPGSGKTTVAVNLALIIAQGGKKVFLVDGDLRRPQIHRLLGMSQDIGLSDVFRDRKDVEKALQSWGETGEFFVINSGSPPPNPAELLASPKMGRILAEVRDLADIVIIDSPPFLVADAALLAAQVDGVVLVARPGRTTAAALKASLEQLHRANAHVVGIVLNRIPHKGGSYYYGGYKHYYYAADSGHGLKLNGHRGPGTAQKKSRWSRRKSKTREEKEA